jgi:hypothetical protein
MLIDKDHALDKVHKCGSSVPRQLSIDKLAQRASICASLPDVKPDLHPKTIMLCIWWDMNSAIYFELLDINQTITANVYSLQLQ